MENKGGIKKAFGFLILVIAISMVGIELVMSIIRSYGAQMESRHMRFRATKKINNTSDGELSLHKKIVQMDIKGMITAEDVMLRVFRRKAERDQSVTRTAQPGAAQQGATPQQGTTQPEAAQPAGATQQPATTPQQGAQSGTSGGGGQDAAAGDPTLREGGGSGGGEPVGDPTLREGGAAGAAGAGDATEPAADQGAGGAGAASAGAPSNINESLKKEIIALFAKVYSPEADEKTKFEGVVNTLASDDAAKALKMFIEKKVTLETLLKLEADFYANVVKLFSKIDKRLHEEFVKIVDYEYTAYKKEGIDKFLEMITYFETDESVKKAGLSLKKRSVFRTYASLYGLDTDSIRDAIKYLVKKEEDRQDKMRYLSKPIYKISLWAVSIIYMLGCVMFILKSDIARIFVMFFGIVKIAFLLTVPISVLNFVVGLIVLLSIAAICLSFVSMYIVGLRPKKA